MSILEEVRNMTKDEKQELLKILQGSEEKPEPEVRELGKPMRPNRRGPRGEELTEEQYYDLHHPMEGTWPEKAYDIIQGFDGKKTIVRHTKEEIEEHNRQIREEWIQAKRKYAARHGFTDWTDEYNPPKGPKYNWEHL